MKKYFVFMCAIMLVFGMVGVASSTPYYEEYRGLQLVNEGDTFNFLFDFWRPNNVGPATDSSLSLTQDATGGWHGAWDSATLLIKFWSVDFWAEETAGITLKAYGNDTEFDLGTITFNPGLWDGFMYNYDYDFTAAQLTAFSEWGWGNVAIQAVPIDGEWWEANNFFIKKVGLSVAIPEPATLLLLGSGLIGVAVLRRKLKK